MAVLNGVVYWTNLADNAMDVGAVKSTGALGAATYRWSLRAALLRLTTVREGCLGRHVVLTTLNATTLNLDGSGTLAVGQIATFTNSILNVSTPLAFTFTFARPGDEGER